MPKMDTVYSELKTMHPELIKSSEAYRSGYEHAKSRDRWWHNLDADDMGSLILAYIADFVENDNLTALGMAQYLLEMAGEAKGGAA